MNITKEKKSIFSFVKKIISGSITIVLLLIAIIIVSQRVFDKAFLGYRIYIVATGSMVPVYNIGDVVLSKERIIENIKVGDDLVYVGEKGQINGKTITHRVIEIIKDGYEISFRTKGVANNTEDPIVSSSQVKGTVVRKLPIVTYICALAQNKYTVYFCIILPITVFVFFRIIHTDIRKEH